jgi:hypothetical protein
MAQKREKIELCYNGFHGHHYFNVLATVEHHDGAEYGMYTTVTISKSTAQRINRVVGCKTHNVVFGNRYKIKGACSCGEGLRDITGNDYNNLDDICIHVSEDYEYRGNYPQSN